MSFEPSLNPGLGAQSATRVTPCILPSIVSLLYISNRHGQERQGFLPSSGKLRTARTKDLCALGNLRLKLDFCTLPDARDAVHGLPTGAEWLAQIGFHIFRAAQRDLFDGRHMAGRESFQNVIVPQGQVF